MLIEKPRLQINLSCFQPAAACVFPLCSAAATFHQAAALRAKQLCLGNMPHSLALLYVKSDKLSCCGGFLFWYTSFSLICCHSPGALCTRRVEVWGRGEDAWSCVGAQETCREAMLWGSLLMSFKRKSYCFGARAFRVALVCVAVPLKPLCSNQL